MKTPSVRLHSHVSQAALDDLNDLRGQALADAEYQKKLGVLKWRAQRDILASYGRAMVAYAGQWEALDGRHSEQMDAFNRREASVTGRIINLARTTPSDSIPAAMRHLRQGMLSANIRQNALSHIQKRERADLAFRQQLYRECLCKPHLDVLNVLSRTAGPEPDDNEIRHNPSEFQGVLLSRARVSIAKEMARCLGNEPQTQGVRVAPHVGPPSPQRKNERGME